MQQIVQPTTFQILAHLHQAFHELALLPLRKPVRGQVEYTPAMAAHLGQKFARFRRKRQKSDPAIMGIRMPLDHPRGLQPVGHSTE